MKICFVICNRYRSLRRRFACVRFFKENTIVVMQTPGTSPLSDQPSKALNILSFICPPVGLIVYLALIGPLPYQALSAAKSATKGAVTYLICLPLWLLGVFVLDAVLPLFNKPETSQTTVTTVKPPVAPR